MIALHSLWILGWHFSSLCLEGMCAHFLWCETLRCRPRFLRIALVNLKVNLGPRRNIFHFQTTGKRPKMRALRMFVYINALFQWSPQCAE